MHKSFTLGSLMILAGILMAGNALVCGPKAYHFGNSALVAQVIIGIVVAFVGLYGMKK